MVQSKPELRDNNVMLVKLLKRLAIIMPESEFAYFFNKLAQGQGGEKKTAKSSLRRQGNAELNRLASSEQRHGASQQR